MAKRASIKGPNIAKQQKRFEKAVREGFKAAVEYWQRTFGPRHFDPSAYSRYGYKHRTRKYTARKRKEKGHTVPLVWSGASRRIMKTRFAQPTVRKSQKTHQFTVRKNLGIRLYGRQGELLTTTDEEIDAMAGETLRMVERELASIAAEQEVKNVG